MKLLKLFILYLISLLFTWCDSHKEDIAPSKNIYWGDLHNHCDVGYARGSLDRAYDIARSHLDFYCFTPHSQWHDQPENSNVNTFKEAYLRVNKDFGRVKKLANDFYEPGKFVSFIGYEWHSSRYGDNCIIMPGSEAELVYPLDILELQQFAREQNALLIPHHPAYMRGSRGQDWNFLGEMDITPVVEIYSEHGNAESDRAPFPYIRHSMGGRYTRNTIQYLWNQGKQAGVIACSDDHLGYPGGYGEGLTAIYSDKLTRESIMEALRARRTYAVSADRLELDFRLNGHFMGESIPFTTTRNIYVKVKGKDAVERIEVLRNNEVIYRHFPVDEKPGNFSWNSPVLCRIEFGWGPWGGFNAARIADWDFDVKVRNGKILAATPCFQSGPLDENRRNRITYQDENSCRFRSYTSRTDAFEEKPTNSVIFEIQGSPETDLVLSLAEPSVINHEISLKELSESNDIFFTGDITSESVMVHRVVFKENYSAEFDFKDKRETDETDFYYIRVIQTNGSMAWSSPIWINKNAK